jgi:hypothetical protein
MSKASIGEIVAEGFSARSENRGSAIIVWLRGNADMAVHERLKAFLDALSAATESKRPSEAVFEIEELYFMNSSCLSLLLRFLNGALKSPSPKGYKIRFRSNPNLRWQKKSLQALHAYAPDLVIVE